MRLHLQGLESFQVTNGKIALRAAVTSHDVPPKVHVWLDDAENAPLDAKSPYWMEIRLIGKDGKPARAIPLKDGYFEVPLPAAFFAQNPASITVDWIDFYRN